MLCCDMCCILHFKQEGHSRGFGVQKLQMTSEILVEKYSFMRMKDVRCVSQVHCEHALQFMKKFGQELRGFSLS